VVADHISVRIYLRKELASARPYYESRATDPVGFKNAVVHERKDLVKFERQEDIFVFLKEGNAESKHSLNSASQTIIIYSEDNLQREPVASG
jgi:hypothetical protein